MLVNFCSVEIQASLFCRGMRLNGKFEGRFFQLSTLYSLVGVDLGL